MQFQSDSVCGSPDFTPRRIVSRSSTGQGAKFDVNDCLILFAKMFRKQQEKLFVKRSKYTMSYNARMLFLRVLLSITASVYEFDDRMKCSAIVVKGVMPLCL